MKQAEKCLKKKPGSSWELTEESRQYDAICNVVDLGSKLSSLTLAPQTKFSGCRGRLRRCPKKAWVYSSSSAGCRLMTSVIHST